MTHVYAPGCALMLYKPHLAARVLDFLNEGDTSVGQHLTCCHHNPKLEPGSVVVNTCAGCDRRYRELYPNTSTVSLWERLAISSSFEFPDYGGVEMAIHDACPTRSEERVHTAVRALLGRMNIVVVEPAATRTKAVCCGDSFFGALPDNEVKSLMVKRASTMTRDDVVVYCVSCIKSMHIGGKRPRYLVDLLFAEKTDPGVFEPAEWHAQLDEFIASH